MPFKMVLWCNGSTRDFGSLRDCSIQSGTTQFIFLYLNYIHTCMTACESSCTLFIVDVFRRFLFMILKYYISTACDKSLSFAIKACR